MNSHNKHNAPIAAYAGWLTLSLFTHITQVIENKHVRVSRTRKTSRAYDAFLLPLYCIPHTIRTKVMLHNTLRDTVLTVPNNKRIERFLSPPLKGGVYVTRPVVRDGERVRCVGATHTPPPGAPAIADPAGKPSPAPDMTRTPPASYHSIIAPLDSKNNAMKIKSQKIIQNKKQTHSNTAACGRVDHDAEAAWLLDLFLQSGERPWGLDPTPLPTLPDDKIESVLAQVVDDQARRLLAGEPPFTPHEARAIALELEQKTLEALPALRAALVALAISAALCYNGGMSEHIPNKKKRAPKHKHIPTDATREAVAVMSGFGLKQDYIARVIGCEKQTLLRCYRRELDEGIDAVTRECASLLLEKARNGSEVAAMFLLKARAHWRDNAAIAAEISGPVTIKVIYETPSNAEKNDIPKT